VGLAEEEGALRARIATRVRQMASAGAAREVTAAIEAGASRTARAAIGFEEFPAGDLDLAATRHWQYARRQMTWMRRMNGVRVVERKGLDDESLAAFILGLTDRLSSHNACDSPSG
jgi:tRNA dimethylallyltransferase